MTTSIPTTPSRTLSVSLAQRCAAWITLIGIGNLTVLAVPFVLSRLDLGQTWASVSAAIMPFVLPAYSPTLLFFTVILTILERSDRQPVTDAIDHAQANRLIANSIRLALLLVLSFGVLIVIARPTDVAVVLFATLVGFVSMVRAELMDPPRRLASEALYRRALLTQQDAERSAVRALGPEWRERSIAKRSTPTLVLFFATPVVLPAALILIVASIRWGIDDALTANFVIMSFVLMLGPAVLVMAWLSTADKSESSMSRGWRLAFLVLISCMGTLVLGGLFLASGREWAWVGWIVLGDAIVVALCLWLPMVPFVSERRRRVERLWTAKRLNRLNQITREARDQWRAELAPPSRLERSLARIIRPFRAAYRLARPAEQTGDR